MSHLRRAVVAPAAPAIASLVLFAWIPGTMPAGAQGDAARNRIAPATEAVSRRSFLREIHRSLKAYDERLTGLADHLLAGQDPSPNLRAMVLNLLIAAKSAQAGYMNAKLTREVAEIAIREYREGIYVQDLLTIEGEIRLAQSDLGRAGDLVQFARRDADRLWAQLQEEGRRLRCESLELKKIALVDYAGPRQLKELEAEMAKARTDERVKEAAWQVARKRLETAEKAMGSPGPRAEGDHRHRALLLMTRAIAIEENLQASLARQAESGGTLVKEIRELTNELGSIVGEAEAEAAASDLDGVRRRIRGVGRGS